LRFFKGGKGLPLSTHANEGGRTPGPATTEITPTITKQIQRKQDRHLLIEREVAAPRGEDARWMGALPAGRAPLVYQYAEVGALFRVWAFRAAVRRVLLAPSRSAACTLSPNFPNQKIKHSKNQNHPYQKQEPFGFRRKEFYQLHRAEKLLRDFIPRLCHESDGLILQPHDDPYIPRTCDDLLKWKFDHLNSVDFKLEVLFVNFCVCVGGVAVVVCAGGCCCVMLCLCKSFAGLQTAAAPTSLQPNLV
jgi:hypothetical protein